MWKFNTDTIEGQITPQIEHSLQKGFAKATIEFKANGTYASTGFAEPDAGKWSVDGDVLTTISNTPDKDKHKPEMKIDSDKPVIHLSFKDQGFQVDLDKTK